MPDLLQQCQFQLGNPYEYSGIDKGCETPHSRLKLILMADTKIFSRLIDEYKTKIQIFLFQQLTFNWNTTIFGSYTTCSRKIIYMQQQPSNTLKNILFTYFFPHTTSIHFISFNFETRFHLIFTHNVASRIWSLNSSVAKNISHIYMP